MPGPAQFFLFQCHYCFCTFLKASDKLPSSSHSTIYRELSCVYLAQCMPITLLQRDASSSVLTLSTMFNAFDVHNGNSFLNRNKKSVYHLVAQQHILQNVTPVRVCVFVCVGINVYLQVAVLRSRKGCCALPLWDLHWLAQHHSSWLAAHTIKSPADI